MCFCCGGCVEEGDVWWLWYRSDRLRQGEDGEDWFAWLLRRVGVGDMFGGWQRFYGVLILVLCCTSWLWRDEYRPIARVEQDLDHFFHFARRGIDRRSFAHSSPTAPVPSGGREPRGDTSHPTLMDATSRTIYSAHDATPSSGLRNRSRMQQRPGPLFRRLQSHRPQPILYIKRITSEVRRERQSGWL